MVNVAKLMADRLALAQGIEDLIAVAETEDDADGFIKAYHFKTGALHRLLALARELEPGARRDVTHEARRVLADFGKTMREETIPAIVEAVDRRNEAAKETRKWITGGK